MNEPESQCRCDTDAEHTSSRCDFSGVAWADVEAERRRVEGAS